MRNSTEKSSGGAGSRGGHVIGHTKSGKPIYESGNSVNSKVLSAHSAGDSTHEHVKAAYPTWGKEDHLDAADHHDQAASSATTAQARSGAHAMAQAHSMASMSMRKAQRPRAAAALRKALCRGQ